LPAPARGRARHPGLPRPGARRAGLERDRRAARGGRARSGARDQARAAVEERGRLLGGVARAAVPEAETGVRGPEPGCRGASDRVTPPAPAARKAVLLCESVRLDGHAWPSGGAHASPPVGLGHGRASLTRARPWPKRYLG